MDDLVNKSGDLVNDLVNDCISRQAALTALRTCYDTNLIVLDNGDELIHYGDAVGAIEALPSAQSGCEDAVYRKAVQMLLAYFVPEERYAEAVDGLRRLPPAQPVEDARAMCGECDAWNKYKNYPQPEQFNPCTVCQEFDCTGCKFRRT